jgi:hypothetical protein
MLPGPGEWLVGSQFRIAGRPLLPKWKSTSKMKAAGLPFFSRELLFEQPATS